jgi:hypothetical protein
MTNKNIPTDFVEIGKGKDKIIVEMYQWLTQTEEDKFHEILLGDNDLDVSRADKTDEVKILTNFVNFNKANLHLVQCYLKNMTIEEYDCLKPMVRAEILGKCSERKNKKK